MRSEYEAELRQRYPKLFRQLSLERMVDRGPIDERGIECGDGWFDIIDRLCFACEGEIESLAEKGLPEGDWPRVVQIKEKMGSLRFYIRGKLSDHLRALKLHVETVDSVKICEQCGSPGRLRQLPWRQTLCDKCTEEIND